MKKILKKRENRIICLPFNQETYLEIVNDAVKFRIQLDGFIVKFPELFPESIVNGYQLKETRFSKKLSLPTKRIRIGRKSYTIRPSFVMPYMTAHVVPCERALFMRKYSVPFQGLCHSFGSYSQKWFRMEQNIGRNSLVGTTFQKASDLPKHLIADEKHTWIKGQKAYLATTVANDCLVGVSLSKNANETELTKAYGVFQTEALQMKPDYEPQTVTTDGWQATQNAWQTLFPSLWLILCFLHLFLKIKKNTQFTPLLSRFYQKLWSCFRASNKRSFSQRVRRLSDWTSTHNLPGVVSDKIAKLRHLQYTKAYDYPEAPRTTNMVDRLMRNRPITHLFNTQYFHGHSETAESSIRGWALIQNFTPSNPRTIQKHNGWKSPAERLNQFRYHDNWLQNLLVSASQQQFDSPPNPL